MRKSKIRTSFQQIARQSLKSGLMAEFLISSPVGHFHWVAVLYFLIFSWFDLILTYISDYNWHIPFLRSAAQTLNFTQILIIGSVFSKEMKKITGSRDTQSMKTSPRHPLPRGPPSLSVFAEPPRRVRAARAAPPPRLPPRCNEKCYECMCLNSLLLMSVGGKIRVGCSGGGSNRRPCPV